jgi:hypothetical protein
MKLLLAALFAIGLASLPVQQVAACSCMQATPQEAAARADAVFAGTVVNQQPVGVESGPVGAMAATLPAPAPFGQMIYTFSVDGVAKGEVGSGVDVLAGGDGASCGMSFAPEERWLIFTTWDGAIHSTGLCSGNVLLEKGVEAPLPLTAPTGDDSGSGLPEIPVTVLALLGVIGAVAGVSWLAFRRGSESAAS